MYYNNTIYFDSPGSHKFKDLYGHIPTNPKSYKNQSLSYYKNGSYLSDVKNFKIELKAKKSIKIQYSIYNKKELIERHIRISKKGIRMTDKKIKGNGKLVTQFLTSPYLVGALNENHYKINEIEIFSNSTLKKRKGWISYDRGKIEETKILHYENKYKNTISLRFDLEEINKYIIVKNNKMYTNRNHYYLLMIVYRNVRRYLNAFVKLNKYFKLNN